MTDKEAVPAMTIDTAALARGCGAEHRYERSGSYEVYAVTPEQLDRYTAAVLEKVIDACPEPRPGSGNLYASGYIQAVNDYYNAIRALIPEGK